MDRRHEARALGTDVEGRAAWLIGLATRLVRDGAAAEDACQDAWLGALRTGHPPSRAALVSGVRRSLSGQWRAQRRRARREREAARVEALPAIDDTLQREELERELLLALGDLEEPFQSTLRARFDEGLESSVIAARLGLTTEAVRWRIREGAARLRRALERRGVLGLLAFGAQPGPTSAPTQGATPASGAAPQATSLTSAAQISAVVLIGMKSLTIAAATLLAVAWFLVRLPSSPAGSTPETAGAAPAVPERASPAPAALEASVARSTPERARVAAEDSTLPQLPEAPPALAPATLELRFALAPGLLAPKRATVQVVGDILGGVRATSILLEDAEVAEGRVTVELRRSDEFELHPIDGTWVFVSAAGVTDTRVSLGDVDWTEGATNQVEVRLRPASDLHVQAVDGHTRVALEEVGYKIVGETELPDGAHVRKTSDPLRIAVPFEGAEGDWLFVHARVPGLAARAWPLTEVLGMPPDSDGVRRLELLPGGTIEGRITAEDGLPLLKAAAVHYRVRLGDGTSDVTYPHWIAREGLAPLDRDGRFRISGLAPGTCVLELREDGRRINGPGISPARQVRVHGDESHYLDWTVASAYDELVLNLAWHTSDEVALFFELYRLTDDPAAPRRLLATRHFMDPLVPEAVRLDPGTLVADGRYELRVGNDVNGREAHPLRVEGSRVVLEHRFVAGAGGTPLVAQRP